MSMGLVVVNDLVKVEYRGTFISHINVAFGLGAACGAGKRPPFWTPFLFHFYVIANRTSFLICGSLWRSNL
jgi:hypothetical protein